MNLHIYIWPFQYGISRRKAIASTSNRAHGHCELCGGLGRGFLGSRAMHLSPRCLWHSYACAACRFDHSLALVNYGPILRCAYVVHICAYAGMGFPTGELLPRGPTQPAVDRARIRMPRTEGGSLQSAVTSRKYNHVKLDLCRVVGYLPILRCRQVASKSMRRVAECSDHSDTQFSCSIFLFSISFDKKRILNQNGDERSFNSVLRTSHDVAS